jgi:hypothetical protein
MYDDPAPTYKPLKPLCNTKQHTLPHFIMDLPGMKTKHNARSRSSTTNMIAVYDHPFPSEQQVLTLPEREAELNPTILHSALVDTQIRQ